MVLVVSITLIIRPAVTTGTIIASALAMASASRLAVVITLMKISAQGYDKILDCPGKYGFDSHYFDIGLHINSGFIDLCHVNCGL